MNHKRIMVGLLSVLFFSASAIAQNPPLSIADLVGFYTLEDKEKVVKILEKNKKVVDQKQGVYDYFTDSLTSMGVGAQLHYWIIGHNGMGYTFAIYDNDTMDNIIKYRFPKKEFDYYKEEMEELGIDKVVDTLDYRIYRGQVGSGVTVDVIFDGHWRWASIRLYKHRDFNKLDPQDPEVAMRNFPLPGIADWSNDDRSGGPGNISDTAITHPYAPMGMRGFYEFIYDKISYPRKLLDARIQGTVKVEYVIWSDGRIVDLSVKSTPHPALAEEVFRIISLSPNWIPGTEHGEQAPVYFNLPVRFSLN